MPGNNHKRKMNHKRKRKLLGQNIITPHLYFP